MSNLSTTSNFFEEFLWNQMKYINSKNYISGRRLSIILDNASYHKTKKISDKLIGMNCNVLYLPPYTPQFQPIDIFFGIAKCKLRELKVKDAVKLNWKEGESLVHNVLKSINPASIIKCFNKAIVSFLEVLK